MKSILPVVTAFALSICITAPGAASAGDGYACDEAAAAQPILVAKGGGSGGGTSSGSGSYRGYRTSGSSSSRGQGGFQSSGEGGYKGVPGGKSEDQPIPNATRNLPTSAPVTPPTAPPGQN